jgi:AcrR family transcriptional regulator
VKFNDKHSEQRVLDKTAELLFRRGIKGWNMDQLSAEAGLAKNTLYRMIGSKEQLIERVILDYCRRGHLQMVGMIKREAGYLETLEVIAKEFPEHMNSLYADFMQEVFLEYPGVEKTVRGYRDDMTGQITDFIRRGIAEGYLREDLQPELLFELLQAMILSFVQAGFKGAELSGRIHEGFRCLLYGVVLPHSNKSVTR